MCLTYDIDLFEAQIWGRTLSGNLNHFRDKFIVLFKLLRIKLLKQKIIISMKYKTFERMTCQDDVSSNRS